MIEKFSWNLVDSLGEAIVGATPALKIRELATGLTLDWADGVFKSSGWTIFESPMSEVGAPYPGLYESEIDLGTLNGKFQIFVESGPYVSTTEINVVDGVISTFQARLTAEQETMLMEIYALLGLDPTRPLVNTKTSRQAGAIVQHVNSTSTQTTVTRIP